MFLGTPNDRIWPEITSCALIRSNTINLTSISKRFPYNTLPEKLPFLSTEGIEFLQQLFTYRPTLRITAREALRHGYFTTTPYPKDEDLMPTFPSFHDEMMKEDDEKKKKDQPAKKIAAVSQNQHAVGVVSAVNKKRKHVG